MTAGSAAASVWWTFWTDYLTAVFQPWWNRGRCRCTGTAAG